jgi:hypothetical protein
MRVPQRSDGIEPLLIGHDKQNVRLTHIVIPSEAKNLGSISMNCRPEKARDVSLRSTWQRYEPNAR